FPTRRSSELLRLVVGSRRTAAVSATWGWRAAAAMVTVAAAILTAAARATLPDLPVPAGRSGGPAARGIRRFRDRRLLTLSALTCVGVAGHFISYTFLVLIVRDVVGVRGAPVAWPLPASG